MQLTDVFAYLFDVGQDVLFAGLDKVQNTILCQLGDAIGQTADSDAAELWQQPGLWSLPAAPTQGKASCQAIRLKRGDRDIIFATRDLRSSSIYGNLKPGETCVGASDAASQARALFKLDGSASLITTDDNTPTGNSVFLRLSPTAFQVVAPWGTIIFDATGFHVKTASGARLDLGGIFGLPAPFNALTSYAKLSAGTVKCDGTQVLLGPDLPTTAYLPAAYGPDPAPAPLVITGIKSSTVRMAP